MTRSAKQRTGTVWRRAVREGIDSISRAAINWESWVLLAISLALIVLSCLAFDSATLRDRLPVVLLAMYRATATIHLEDVDGGRREG